MDEVDETGFALTNCLCILCREGHISETWDPSNPDEVAHARATFDYWRGKGYLAYRAEGAERGEQVQTFEAQMGTVILAPPLRGG